MNHLKIKEIKQENQFVPLAICYALRNLMGRFATPYYEDGERIRGILQQLGAAHQESVQHVVNQFREKHGLPADEELNENHPLASTLNRELTQALTSLKQGDIAQFTKAQLQTAIDGRDWQFNDREIVEYWLIKK